MKFDHVAIKSTDIFRDVDWYCKNFECEIESIDPTWASLKTKCGTRIALVTPSQHPNHIAFLQESKPPDDVKTHRDGTLSKYLKDPSGNVVELLWRRT